MIKIIAIVDADFGISKNGGIPWSFGEDLQFFREKTVNQTIIMGRKTFFSLPHGPLKDRQNCIVSRKFKSIPDADKIFESLESAITCHPDSWIIGGANIFNYALAHGLVDYALITKVKSRHGADTFLSVHELENSFEQKLIEDKKKFAIFEFIKNRKPL